MTHAASTVDAKILSTIAGACRDNDQLRFAYRSHDGASSSRTVEPHRLVYTGHRWYLVAWDADRKDWRTFRVDRIDAKLSLGARFTPRKPPDRDIAAYVSRSVSIAPYQHRARKNLHAPVEKIAAMILLPPDSQVIDKDVHA
jgi:predicted DNA-binding transcriptional regulator YafY